MAIRGVHINAPAVRNYEACAFLHFRPASRPSGAQRYRSFHMAGVLDRSACYVVTSLQQMGPPSRQQSAAYHEAVSL
jgi:hypothetical protein